MVKKVSVLAALWRAFRDNRRPGAPGVRERLSAVPRMARATLLGRYHGLTRGRLALMALAALYLLSPVDLAPEMLLKVFGLADDAIVAFWLAGTALGEAEQFLSWESARIVPGSLVDGAVDGGTDGGGDQRPAPET